MSHLEVLESELRTFQIELPSPQKIRLAQYCDELAHWNQKINLTGLQGADMVRRLVIEPVWTALQLKPSGVLVDIGSGNGSPAIPLDVVCDFERAYLIEARGKRAAFLRHVTTTLTLSNAIIHRSRFEAVIPEIKSVDWISLQGVALTTQLMESIRQIAATTTKVVWISSSEVEPPMTPLRTLTVPITGTEVFLFQLD